MTSGLVQYGPGTGFVGIIAWVLVGSFSWWRFGHGRRDTA
jgi:hypothetical protein